MVRRSISLTINGRNKHGNFIIVDNIIHILGSRRNPMPCVTFYACKKWQLAKSICSTNICKHLLFYCLCIDTHKHKIFSYTIEQRSFIESPDDLPEKEVVFYLKKIQIPKNLSAVLVVILANSSTSTFFTSAIFCATYFTKSGSFLFPRIGTGAR